MMCQLHFCRKKGRNGRCGVINVVRSNIHLILIVIKKAMRQSTSP